MTSGNSKHSGMARFIVPMLLASGVALSSCVSSTIQSATTDDLNTDARPASQLALSEEARDARAARLRAIEDIHAKADAVPNNVEAPAYGLPRSGEVDRLTPAQIAAKTNALTAISTKTNALIPAATLTAKQREIAALRAKGATHYNNAMAKIKKSN